MRAVCSRLLISSIDRATPVVSSVVAARWRVIKSLFYNNNSDQSRTRTERGRVKVRHDEQGLIEAVLTLDNHRNVLCDTCQNRCVTCDLQTYQCHQNKYSAIYHHLYRASSPYYCCHSCHSATCSGTWYCLARIICALWQWDIPYPLRLCQINAVVIISN